MANVQAENGYTRIANEVLEALVKVRLPPSEKDILLFILRKTYGWGKTQDRISLTQFEKGTDLSRPTVVKALSNLITRKMIVKAGLLLSFNKDYEKWVVNAGLLVKSKHEFGKGGFTKTSKGGFTYKRKKKTKEIPAKAVVNMKNYKEKTINYDTNEPFEEEPKTNKNKEAIRLAVMFDEMASEYTNKPIKTPKSYFIILNAMKAHDMTSKGVEKLFYDWFYSKTKQEDKVKLSFALSANNINAFKVKNG